MSRVASNPITVPSNVAIHIEAQRVSIKGPKGMQEFVLHPGVEICHKDSKLTFQKSQVKAQLRRIGGQTRNAGNALAGTSRAIVNNMITGVTKGFEKKLTLVGVGYRAQVKGNTLDLVLGFSHPVLHSIPEGITITSTSPTELVISGVDKQKVGQVAAEIRAYRPPEPYKGKGVRYSDEVVILKETKK